MKTLKAIIARILALWALLLFAVTLLLFIIPFTLFCYFIPDPRKTRRFVRYSRVWMNVYLPLVGCPLTIRGREHFAPGETYIVVCNHNSFMDVPITTPAIPGGNKTIAKVEIARTPLFGMIYRTGSVLVDRKRDASRKESYTQMKNALSMGLHMCIYPEGTRNRTPQPLKSFHNGAFRLAAETGKSLLPAVISHTRDVLPASKFFYFMPHRLEIEFLPPVAVGANDDADTLKEKVFGVMEQRILEKKGS